MEINEVLELLDHDDDSHWAADGLPRLEVVQELVGNTDLTIKDLPEFRRKKTGPTIQDLDNEINDLIAEKDKLENQIHHKLLQRQALAVAQDKTRNPKTDTENRLAFIKAQNELRAEKAARTQHIFQSGVRPEDLDPRAPIDRELSRRRRNGNRTPTTR